MIYTLFSGTKNYVDIFDSKTTTHAIINMFDTYNDYNKLEEYSIIIGKLDKERVKFGHASQSS